MAASNTDRFKKAKRKFETTVGVGGILAGGTTLPLTSVTGLDTTTAVTLVVGAGTATEEVITGVVSGSSLINCVRGKEGTTDSAHSAGESVNMYFTETHWDDVMDGILVDHKQDGTHSDINADSITATTGTFTNLTIAGTATPEGWSALGATPNTITALGNRSYSMVFNGTDLTDTLSPGMKLKMTRTVTAPTQCADLEASSSQYFSKSSPAGMTFTDDFVVSAWVKLSSYASGAIASRSDGTSGWSFEVNASGQVKLIGFNGGLGNSSQVLSYQSLPLNKWVHIAAQLDMSTFTATTTTSYVMIDGVDVPAAVSRAGTNPTALVQAGNLNIGAFVAGAPFFPGKLAQVAIYNAKVTQATILASMNQGLAGNETNLISAYSFNNTIEDLSSNNNDLTAQNSAVATNTDSPFAGGSGGTTEYAYLVSASFSTNTTLVVSCPASYVLPTSGGINAASYSTHDKPYGWLAENYNPFKFYAFRSAAQTPGVLGRIQWDTKTIDPNNNFDITTNIGRYTVPVTGYYHLIANAGWGSTGANVAIGTSILKNGTTVLSVDRFVVMYAGSYSHEVMTTWFGLLTAGEYVEVYEGSGATYPLVVGNSGESFFSGYLVSKA